MAENFFADFSGALLRHWPEKGVSVEQITGALKTALDPDSLVNALAEVFRVSPAEASKAVEGCGLGELIARKRLSGGLSDEMEALPLCGNEAMSSPFADYFAFYAAPNPASPTSLPKGLNADLQAMSKKVADAAADDPFLQLYRVGVSAYYRKFMAEDAPKIRNEVEAHFPNGSLKYLVTTGIGANEQFCHYAAALNNRNPEKRCEWLVIHSPIQLCQLPADATEENTLFMEFSRSSMTEETLKTHEYTSRKLRRIVFSNGGGLKALAERDGNLTLELPDRVSGRYGRNKTPILLAPMLVCGMDTEGYWRKVEEAISAFDLTDPDSLPHVIARFILAFQKARGTDFIYLGCNDDTLGLLADEFIQFWNEGVNKGGNDLLMSRFFGLPRDSHMNLEGVLGNAQTKLGFFLLRDSLRSSFRHPLVNTDIDPIRGAHAGLTLGDEEAALSLANYKRFGEVMPSLLLSVKGELSMAHSAILGQLSSDVTFVYSRLMGIDPGSNPEVKFVRERSARLLSSFAAGLREGKAPDTLFGETARND